MAGVCDPPVPPEDVGVNDESTVFGLTSDGKFQIPGSTRLAFSGDASSIVVGRTGAAGRSDVHTVAEGVARAAALAATSMLPVHVYVTPGVYTETNPIVVPPGVVIQGVSTLTVQVIGANLGAAVFAMAPGSTIRDMTIVRSGVAGVAYNGAALAGTQGILQNVIFTGCAVGVAAAGAGSPLLINECAFIARGPTVTVGVGVLATAGASVHMPTCYSAASGGATPTLIGEVARSDGVGTVINILGGGFGGAGIGLRATNGGTIASASVVIRECAVALRCDAGQLDAQAMLIERSAQHDLVITDPAARVRLPFTVLDPAKISNSGCVEIRGLTYATSDAELTARGNLRVGTSYHPRSFHLGGGGPTTRGVYLAAADESATTLPAAMAYVGHAQKFCGLQLVVSVAGSGDLSGVGTEYWNGSAWAPISRCVFADRVLQGTSLAGTGALEVFLGAAPDWTARTLGASTSSVYWLRFRSETATLPTVSAVLACHDGVSFSTSGVETRYGAAARQVRVAEVAAAPGGSTAAISGVAVPTAPTISSAAVLPVGLDGARPLSARVTCFRPDAAAADVTLTWAIGAAGATATASVAAAGITHVDFNIDAAGALGDGLLVYSAGTPAGGIVAIAVDGWAVY